MIEEFLNKNYDFKYDEVLGRVFFKNKEEAKFKLVTDYDLNSIHRRIKKAGLSTSKGNLRDLLQSSFVDKYNPFVDYFSNLPK